MVSMLILFSILALLQAESMANMTLLASARRALDRNVAEDSAYDLLRTVAGQGMISGDDAAMKMFSGNPTSVPVLGNSVTVMLQDVEGIPDLSRDPAEVLSLVPGVGPRVAAAVQVLRQGKGEFPFPTVESSLANLGLQPNEIAGSGPLYNQTGKAEGLRHETMPAELIQPESGAGIAAVFGQVTDVRVEFTR
jgi:hypothetical protein